MKKENIIVFTGLNPTPLPIPTEFSSFAISKELEKAIEELIERLRIGPLEVTK